jgi:hypothetical protein
MGCRSNLGESEIKHPMIAMQSDGILPNTTSHYLDGQSMIRIQSRVFKYYHSMSRFYKSSAS